MRFILPSRFGFALWLALGCLFFIHAGAQIPQFLPDEKQDGEAAAEAEAVEKVHKILGVEVKQDELDRGYDQARRSVAFRKGMQKPLSIQDYLGSYEHYKPVPLPAAAPRPGPGAGASGVGVVGQAEQLKSRLENRFGGATDYGAGANANAGVTAQTPARRTAAPARPPHPSGVVIREKNRPEFKFADGAKVVEVNRKGIIVLDVPGYNYVYVQPRRDYGLNPGTVFPLLLKQDPNRRRGPYKDREDKDPIFLELWQDYTMTQEEYLLALKKNLIQSSIRSVRERQDAMRLRQAEYEAARQASRTAAANPAVGRPPAPAEVQPGEIRSGFRSGVQRRGSFGGAGGAAVDPGAERKGLGRGSRFK